LFTVIVRKAARGVHGHEPVLDKFLVVDGQQRLTTLTLLLAALRDHLIETGHTDRASGIDAQYLINVFDNGKPLKVMPTQTDRPAYMAVLNRAPQAGGEDAVGDAYRFFRSKIAAADDSCAVSRSSSSGRSRPTTHTASLSR
jgi:hypothetical protein